ncbi:MAG: hypothetical protein DDT32_02096 [Syntrophomonadaceae bacterium]|nr:hypothetical protein [Bacillota bacterium]
MNTFAPILFGTNIPFIPVDDQSGVIDLLQETQGIIRRGIIHNKDLQVMIGLIENGLKGSHHSPFSVVSRHADAHQRLIIRQLFAFWLSHWLNPILANTD